MWLQNLLLFFLEDFVSPHLLPQRLPHYTLPQVVNKGCVLPVPCPFPSPVTHSQQCLFSWSRHSGRDEMETQCSFDFFLRVEDVEHFFMYSWIIYIFSSENCIHSTCTLKQVFTI